MNKRILLIVGILLIFPLLLTASSPAKEVARNHCYMVLEPIAEDQKSSKVLAFECFETFSEALFAATNGRVKAPLSSTPEDITEESLAASLAPNATESSVIIGIDYDYSNYGGSSLIYTSSNIDGCTATSSYAAPTMASGWNDRVSSARGYSDCKYFYHYQNTNYGGLKITCTTAGCSSMGTLDNATSSVKLRYNP